MKRIKLFQSHSFIAAGAAPIWLRCAALGLALLLPSHLLASSVRTNYNAAGTFTWTCPDGVTNIQVECWGGGGAGGGANKTGSTATSNNAGGGGGGGGAYSM